MAHPDHDQVIGSLVAARLRGAAARGTTAEPCPDAETWAAYADGGLLPAEVSRLEAHLATCATCRHLVTALVPDGATLESPVEAPAAGGAAVVLPFPRRQVWTWMAAAAGLLMAVTLWSVSRLGQEPELRTADATAVPAEPSMAAPAPAPPAAPAAGGSAASGGAKAAVSMPSADRARGEARRDAGTRSAAPADDLDRRANTPAEAPAAGREAQEPAKPADSKRAENFRQQVNAQPNVVRPHGPLALNQQAQVAQAPPPSPAAPPAAAPAPATAPAQPAPQPAPAPSAPAVADAAGERGAGLSAARIARPGAAPAAERKEEKDKTDAAAAVGALAETVVTTGGPVLPAFAEPGGRLRWRIADNGRRIESSSDGGTTWNSRHTARRGQRLRAGAAPDLASAWVVGDRGLVLRLAVPGGWSVVAPPADVSLVAVAASSADEARVTAADGRVFVTRDGGASWQDAGAGPQ